MKKRATKKQKIKTRFVKKETPNKKNNKLKFWLITGAIILLAILALFLINKYTGKAIDPSNTEDPLGIGLNPEQIPQTPEDAAQVGNDYLKKEWVNILNNSNSTTGKILLDTNNFLHTLSPIFKIFMGIEYSFSWLFFFTFIIWLAIVILIYKAIKEPFQSKTWLSLSISIIVTALGSQSGMITKLLEFMAPILTNVWIRLILVILIGLIIGLYSQAMHKVGLNTIAAKKKEDEERRENKAATVEKIHDIELKGAGI
jgi:hypothetical protein